MVGIVKILSYLGKLGHYRLGNKLLSAVRTGKALHLTSKERAAYDVIKNDFQRILAQETKTSFPKTNILRREFYDMRSGGKFGEGAVGRSYYQRTRSTPMADIDFPGPSHRPSQVIFKNKDEALGNLKEFLKSKTGSKHAFKVYETPAGLRLIDVSKHARGMPIKKYKKIHKATGTDPDYTDYAKQKAKDFGLTVYDARLNPKPGREGDFVARLIGKGKGSRAELDKLSLRETTSIHDDLIKRILLGRQKTGNVDLGGLFGMTDLSKMVKTLPKSDAEMKVLEYFMKMGL